MHHRLYSIRAFGIIAAGVTENHVRKGSWKRMYHTTRATCVGDPLQKESTEILMGSSSISLRSLEPISLKQGGLEGMP